MEGVEPSWPVDRRLLRPVHIPVPPHPHEEPQARAAERAARRSRGRPRGLPLGSCRLETRLAADLELDDLGRARCLLGACRDPDEVLVHFALLSVFYGRRTAPSSSEGAAGEVGDQLRRRGVEADDVEHPRVACVAIPATCLLGVDDRNRSGP